MIYDSGFKKSNGVRRTGFATPSMTFGMSAKVQLEKQKLVCLLKRFGRSCKLRPAIDKDGVVFPLLIFFNKCDTIIP